MGEGTAIEWATDTWNPWQGCAKVSPGCKHCYMFRDKARYGQDPRVVVRSAPSTFGLPLQRKRDGSWRIPPGARVFTCSWSDWFHPDADAWRNEAWAIIKARPDVTFMVLTKRADLIAPNLPPGGLPRNVWLGVSVESQDYAWRVEKLLEVDAAVRFVSAEPLLGPLDLSKWLAGGAISLIIPGGESGPGARPCDVAWIESLIKQCRGAGVACFVKQLGSYPVEHIAPSGAPDDGGDMRQVVLRDRKGGDMDEWPERLRVREMCECGGPGDRGRIV